MSVTPSFRTFALEQLGRGIQGVRSRNMFGGVGIYAGELFFALIADDTLYFKVDDSNRPDFQALGRGPFRPFGIEGETMQYYQVPEEFLDDPDELRVWAEKAIAVARRAKARTSRRGSA
jgi:DNA transformation protein and related proteins